MYPERQFPKKPLVAELYRHAVAIRSIRSNPKHPCSLLSSGQPNSETFHRHSALILPKRARPADVAARLTHGLNLFRTPVL